MAWGEPTWRVRGRLFAQLDDHHHGADRLAVWLPAALGVQELLIKSDPKRFFVPPYVGPRGWIGVRIDGRPNWRLVTTLVHDAYAQVAPTRRPPRETMALTTCGRVAAATRAAAAPVLAPKYPSRRCRVSG